ncbi:MAG TPA: hypothetical protein VKJ07_04830 [Mycobacteriales bacterium]|nr:hypothetical protein [Mycobacteriales bacterium]
MDDAVDADQGLAYDVTVAHVTDYQLDLVGEVVRSAGVPVHLRHE